MRKVVSTDTQRNEHKSDFKNLVMLNLFQHLKKLHKIPKQVRDDNFFCLFIPKTIALILLLSPLSAQAASLDGSQLGLLWCAPFAGILLSLSLLPALAADFWHRHDKKIALIWVAILLIPLTLTKGLSTTTHVVAETMLHHYTPFVILIASLYTITGGIRLKSRWSGTPFSNLSILVVGTFLASWVGTTGAAMILIRPLLESIHWRRHKSHVIVFFIFLVANIGGMLTPLGDPPLFLGFLEGVSFFWTTTHMLDELLWVSVPVLGIFYLLDSWYYKREPQSLPYVPEDVKHLHVAGRRNLIYLGGVLGAVLMSGYWKPEVSFTVLNVPLELQNILRDLIMLAMLGLSLQTTSTQIRQDNQFDWGPLKEVAVIFIAIFVTAVPPIAILHAGSKGALHFVIASVTENGQDLPIMYFWLTGLLSAFLDNAPTYLVFFNVAGGNASSLMTVQASTLAAISSGAVFMGAMTYIGNAPNLMVASIARKQHIKMPGFFGYILWSCAVLLPVFLLMTWVYF